MRWRQAQQLFALFGAVWFILVRIQPAVFGACPAHSSAMPASHGSHAMAMPANAAAMHHAAGAGNGAPAEHHAHQCTCPGSCCGASVLAAPLAPVPLQLVAIVAQAPHFASSPYRAAWTDFVLPFATAPPRSSLA